jgi:hypothetical protein
MVTNINSKILFRAKLLQPATAKGGSSTFITLPCASFKGERGSSYRFEFTDRLPANHWTLGVTVSGEGTQAVIQDSSAAGPVNFYRIRRLR